jgi:hypothetical protein
MTFDFSFLPAPSANVSKNLFFHRFVLSFSCAVALPSAYNSATSTALLLHSSVSKSQTLRPSDNEEDIFQATIFEDCGLSRRQAWLVPYFDHAGISPNPECPFGCFGVGNARAAFPVPFSAQVCRRRKFGDG